MTLTALVIHFLTYLTTRKEAISIGDIKSKMFGYKEVTASDVLETLKDCNYATIEDNRIQISDHGKDFIESLEKKELEHINRLVHDDYDLALVEFLYYRNDYVRLSDFPEILKVTAPQHGNSINDGNLLQSLFRLHAYINEQYDWYIINDIGRGYYENCVIKHNESKQPFNTIYNDYSTKVEGNSNQVISAGAIVNRSFNKDPESIETRELSKKMLEDLPKTKWYRHWGFIVALIAILVAVAIAIFLN